MHVESCFRPADEFKSNINSCFIVFILVSTNSSGRYAEFIVRSGFIGTFSCKQLPSVAANADESHENEPKYWNCASQNQSAEALKVKHYAEG